MSPLDLRGRHPQQAPPPAATLWRCPACNEEQSGPLGAGCVACGAGQPGRKAEASEILPPKPAPLAHPQPIDEAFLAWIKPLRGQHDAATEQLLYEAFKAGVIYGSQHTSGTTAPLAGTAETRTVVAALKLFVAEVLVHAQEEIAAGEFLSVAATEALIQKVERRA